MKTPTRKDTKRIWKAVCKQHGVRFLYSRSWTARKRVKAAKKLLTIMGVKKLDQWLSQRYMTVVVGKKEYILTPERIGAKGTNPKAQIAVLAHELKHVFQVEDVGGWFRFYMDYFLNDSHRANYEAHAECAGVDVIYHLFKGIHRDNPFDKVWRQAYRVDPDDADQAAATYKRLLRKIEKAYATDAGAVVCRVAREILK